MEDINNKEIPHEVIEQAPNKISEVRAMFQPYVHALSPDDRQSIVKMGAKTLSFSELAYELGVKNPGLVPAYVNITALGVDLTNYRNTSPIFTEIEQLARDVSDIHIGSGSEAAKACLAIYKSAKEAAKAGVPGAQVVYEALRDLYPHSGRPKNTNEKKPDQTHSEGFDDLDDEIIELI